MNFAFPPIRNAAWLLVAALLALFSGAVPVAAQSNNVATNSKPQWPHISALLEKWKDTPFDDVRKLAEGGDLTAQHYVGYCYSEGLHVPADATQALAWYERAAKGGYVPSLNNIGVIYRRGVIVPQDIPKAIQYYQRAADAGMQMAMVNLGGLYEETGQREKAFPYYKQAAESGYPNGMIQMYRAYGNGIGVAKNGEESLNWLKRAAETGDANGQYWLGAYYNVEEARDGNYDASGGGRRTKFVKRDANEAVHWFSLAAVQNLPVAQLTLGQLYMASSGVAQDEERGLELIRKAADQDYPDALYRLAMLYARDVGGPRNDNDRPINLLLRATKGGSASTFDQLVYRYKSGLGTNVDLVEAARWYYRAAEVSRSYYPGRIIQEVSAPAVLNDPFCATIRTFAKASTLNDPPALIEVGKLYLTGKDMFKNPARAWLWFSLAAQKGASEARAQIADMEKQMSADELERAKEMLPEFVRGIEEKAPFFRMEMSAGSR